MRLDDLGEQHDVRGAACVVDAHYLSPRIPATTVPPFAVDTGAKVIPVNELVRVADAPSEYVVVGPGKTATDACIWLLDHGLDPTGSAGCAPGSRGCSTAR